MTTIVFVLGRTGCGKSFALRHITKFAERRGWSPVPLNDYVILRKMFLDEPSQADFKQRKFIPTKYGGFDVQDFSVMDAALKTLETRIRNVPLGEKTLVIVEFARPDYSEAFKQFSPDILRDAHYLFIHANVETCVQRVHERVRAPKTEDDYYVSDKILRGYFNTQNIPDKISANLVRFIDNRGPLSDFVGTIYQFVDDLLTEEENKGQEKHVASLEHASV